MYLDKQYDQLYFTTTNEKVTGDKKSEITGMKKGDIYVSKKMNRTLAASGAGRGGTEFGCRRRNC